MGRRPRLATLLLGACVAVFSGAFAQDTGSLIRPAPAQMQDNANTNPVAARRTMYAFAECVIRLKPKSIEAFSGTFPGSGEANRLAHKLAEDDCLDFGQMSFNEPLLRSAVYEGLYRREFAFAPLEDLAALPSPDYAVGGDMTSERDQQAVALRRFADCVVRAEPKMAHTLMISIAGSQRETGAFEGLAPKLSGCLPQGRTLTFSKMQLRGAIGEVLFRLRSQPAPAQG